MGQQFNWKDGTLSHCVTVRKAGRHILGQNQL